MAVERLATAVETMLRDAELDAEYDDDGFGHAWVTPGVRFEEALAMSASSQRGRLDNAERKPQHALGSRSALSPPVPRSSRRSREPENPAGQMTRTHH